MIEAFKNALLATDRDQARVLAASSVDAAGAEAAVESVIVPALEQIGLGWQSGEVSLSQVYMSGRICEELINELFVVEKRPVLHHPPMAIAVLEDFHMLGKRLVLSSLKARGYALVDYGHATAQELVNLVEKDGIEILLISVLMLPSALKVREVVRLLEQRGLHPKIIVGGAPFRLDTGLAREVGAHGSADQASGAAEVIARLMQEGP
jgi:methanogenic corrinoid protein MtbC1